MSCHLPVSDLDILGVQCLLWLGKEHETIMFFSVSLFESHPPNVQHPVVGPWIHGILKDVVSSSTFYLGFGLFHMNGGRDS